MSMLGKFTPEDIELLPYPAYYLNENRIIVRRNKNASPSKIAVMVRARIDKYVSKNNQKRIIALEIGEEIFVDLFYEPAYGAIICRIENGYLMAIRNITAHMLQYISKVMKAIPPFFGNMTGQIESLRLATYQSREEMVKVRHQYNKVLRYQTALARYFDTVSGKEHRNDVCEITTSMNHLLDEAARKLRPNGVDLRLRQTFEHIYIKASSDDLRYAAACLLSIAAENTYDGRIRVESMAIEGEYMFRIVFEPRVDDMTYDGILGGYYGGELLSTAHGHVFFDLLLVQMLAEKCGWYFSVTEVGCSRGVLSFSLFVPIAEEEPFALNCPPDTAPFLEMMLVNVLGPQFDDPVAL